MRVLSIVHDGSSTGGGGLFEDLVEQRGDRLERWVTVADGTGPDAPTRYDAIMVFGGAMHPDQDAEHPWLADEASFLREALEREVPLFGVCLGSQLIARAAGARVGPAEVAEVGWHEVELNDAGVGDPVVGVLPRRLDAFQWHYYTFELPPGATLLARSRAARQAYRLGERTWGIQFHAEVTRRMLDSWFVDGAAELPKPADEVRRETDALLGTWNEHGRRLCGAFLDYAAASA
ncbi:GMP synthase - Glutamine amidotransferase [Gaiella occulta]|uniref:GMP synthase-Glutamine amidotransferase n=1 Tax=Gaiella occulta TaxID=1002870 RepID=A0A7M2Z2H2_9ACTN|nr:type 1 glutamine amidotransferase [Gaiella occulta]RDI75973.1 GMP synthase - Glutamine amidotransferase [Gaiella occulta]